MTASEPEEAKHLHPRIRTVWRVGALIGTLLVLAVLVGAGAVAQLAGLGSSAIWVSIVALAVVALAAGWSVPNIRYRYWTYRIGDDAIEVEHGAAFRTRSVIPYFRVQHVDTSQGPIERRLGLTNLTIHTASAATDAALPGLADAEAERVRRLVLERAGAGDAV